MGNCLFHNFLPDFGDKYAAHVIEGVRASGKPAAEIEQEVQKMNEYDDTLQKQHPLQRGDYFSRAIACRPHDDVDFRADTAEAGAERTGVGDRITRFTELNNLQIP